MDTSGKATRIRLLDFHSAPMRAFHMSWLAFFLCFFAWFGLAPLMPVIRGELHLTKEQVGNSVIASVAITVVARLVVGWLCDRFGPRRTYTGLLVVGAVAVAAMGLAHDYPSFLVLRLAVGAIGASFVVTQCHTSAMFAPSIVGTANATAAGWGNLGGGVAQIVMPLLFGAFVALGATTWLAWRLAMMVAAAALFVTGILYWHLTQDTADGDFENRGREAGSEESGLFARACKDRRVWALACLYAASFGIELTMDNVAALYFTDYFHLSLRSAGAVAGSFGLMNLFARALGGIVSDTWARRSGLKGRAWLLACTIFAEGVGLLLFSQATTLPVAIARLMGTGVFVKMSNGANYALVPFVNQASGRFGCRHRRCWRQHWCGPLGYSIQGSCPDVFAGVLGPGSSGCRPVADRVRSGHVRPSLHYLNRERGRRKQ